MIFVVRQFPLCCRQTGRKLMQWQIWCHGDPSWFKVILLNQSSLLHLLIACPCVYRGWADRVTCRNGRSHYSHHLKKLLLLSPALQHTTGLKSLAHCWQKSTFHFAAYTWYQQHCKSNDQVGLCIIDQFSAAIKWCVLIETLSQITTYNRGL